MTSANGGREFRLPGLILTGPGCLGQTGAATAELGVNHALVVTATPLRESGAVDEATAVLNAAGVATTVFDEINAEPTTDDVEAAVATYETAGANGVVGLGGGSALDTAKAVAVRGVHPGPLSLYQGQDQIPPGRAPLVAIPTTAGTGSEVTRFTILTDRARDVKMLIGSATVIPDVAVADPNLTLTAPPPVTASAGIDALTHAIESYISRRAQPLSSSLALSAISMIGANLRQAWANGQDLAARRAMMDGALVAGMSFTNASVALVHGMARPLGAYFGVPHGLSNAVLLPHVMAYTAPEATAQYAEIARALGEDVSGLSTAAAADRAIAAVDSQCSDVEVPGLTALGVGRDQLMPVVEAMANDALDSGSPANNPRIPETSEIVALYEQAL